jgi:hypothetical protein
VSAISRSLRDSIIITWIGIQIHTSNGPQSPFPYEHLVLLYERTIGWIADLIWAWFEYTSSKPCMNFPLMKTPLLHRASLIVTQLPNSECLDIEWKR